MFRPRRSRQVCYSHIRVSILVFVLFCCSCCCGLSPPLVGQHVNSKAGNALAAIGCEEGVW